MTEYIYALKHIYAPTQAKIWGGTVLSQSIVVMNWASLSIDRNGIQIMGVDIPLF